MPAKKFVVPFAATGNKTAVPNTLQPDGTVSYAQGFGPDYELDKTVDPVNAKDVPRDQTNQLFFDVTEAVGEQQLYGVALWGADRAPYPLNARAYHTGKLWHSNVANNNGEPGVSGWDDVSNVVAEADQVQAEAGTAQGVYSSPLRVFQALRSAAANATELLRGTLRTGTQAEVDAGVLDNVAVTPQKLRGTLANQPFSRVYESPDLTWVSAGAVGPLIHGLGESPKFITYEYRCIIADAGYAVGDRVFVVQPTGQSASDGLAMVGTSTELNGRWGSTRIGSLLNKTTGAITNLNGANWRVVVRAYV